MAEKAKVLAKTNEVTKARRPTESDQVMSPYSSAESFIGGMVIRKAACVCGGGCPSCQPQSSLNDSQPNDPAEMEADRVLDQGYFDQEEQIKDAIGTTSVAFCSPECDELWKVKPPFGAGEPLWPNARNEMETRFRYDFSRVRIHMNDRTTADLGAKAFTYGHDIFFPPGRGPSDRQLLTHEITHVVQQATGESAHLQGAGGDVVQRKALEDQADNHRRQEAGGRITSHQSLRPLPSVTSPVLQFAFESDVLLELHQMPSPEEDEISDVEKRARVLHLAARIQRLHALFNRLSSAEAKRFHERLKERKRGDALSERFRYILSRSERRALLDVLESRMREPPADVPPTSYGPPTGVIRGDAQKLKIKGLPVDQRNYADRSFRGLLSAPVGDVYTLCTGSPDNCHNGISIPKTEFYLDDDPLTKGVPVLMQSVFPSRDVAEAVLAEIRVYQPKDMPLVSYYLRDGIIFPTTLSETTLPNLIPQVRAKRNEDRGDVKATADLAWDVAWWYAGMRFPLRVKLGGGSVGAPAAKAAFSGAQVAEDLFVATKSVTGNVNKMFAAARQLSSMNGLTAVQKADVMVEFFQKIGSAAGRSFGVTLINGAPFVDEGANLFMISANGRSAFRFIKSTGEIIVGKLGNDGQWVWGAIR